MNLRARVRPYRSCSPHESRRADFDHLFLNLLYFDNLFQWYIDNLPRDVLLHSLLRYLFIDLDNLIFILGRCRARSLGFAQSAGTFNVRTNWFSSTILSSEAHHGAGGHAPASFVRFGKRPMDSSNALFFFLNVMEPMFEINLQESLTRLKSPW